MFVRSCRAASSTSSRSVVRVPREHRRPIASHATTEPVIATPRALMKRSISSGASARMDVVSNHDTPSSTWDHIFKELPNSPPIVGLQPYGAVRNRQAVTPHPHPRPRRQAMTAQEISAFDDMFNMIFQAVASHRAGTPPPTVPLDGESTTPSTSGIGRGANVQQLVGRLRGHSRRVQWTSEADAALDAMKEQMELCDSDQELFAWAMRKVFDESRAMEARAQGAVAEAREGGPLATVKLTDALPMLQSPTYPRVLAHLMRTFRDKYQDPHLALSMFDHARHLSIPSYVFGCTTPAYNELLETRWTCFRDLRGVYEALLEMKANGIEPDHRTRQIVEVVRREVGERTLWVEEAEEGSGEVWGMLDKIVALTAQGSKSFRSVGSEAGDEPGGAESRPAKSKGRFKKGLARFEPWKSEGLDDATTDDWKFGEWSDWSNDIPRVWRSRNNGGRDDHLPADGEDDFDRWESESFDEKLPSMTASPRRPRPPQDDSDLF